MTGPRVFKVADEDLPVEKRCNRCATTRPRAEFYRSSRTKDGLGYHCKPCAKTFNREYLERKGPEAIAARSRELRHTNPSRDRTLLKKRLKKYGLTVAEFNEMVRRQMGCCGLCGQERDLVVDHDHETGKVRELLCHTCNIGLGHVERNMFVARCEAYLMHYSPRSVTW